MYIKADVATTTLRFEMGTRVECNCAGGWEAGTFQAFLHSTRTR